MSKRTKVKFGVEVLEADDIKLLYIHNVPVAAYTPRDGLVRSDIDYGDVATRQTEEFLNGASATVVQQEYIDQIESELI